MSLDIQGHLQREDVIWTPKTYHPNTVKTSEGIRLDVFLGIFETWVHVAFMNLPLLPHDFYACLPQVACAQGEQRRQTLYHLLGPQKVRRIPMFSERYHGSYISMDDFDGFHVGR